MKKRAMELIAMGFLIFVIAAPINLLGGPDKPIVRVSVNTMEMTGLKDWEFPKVETGALEMTGLRDWDFPKVETNSMEMTGLRDWDFPKVTTPPLEMEGLLGEARLKEILKKPVFAAPKKITTYPLEMEGTRVKLKLLPSLDFGKPEKAKEARGTQTAPEEGAGLQLGAVFTGAKNKEEEIR